MIILRQKEYGLVSDAWKKVTKSLRDSINKDKKETNDSQLKAIMSRRGADMTEDIQIMRRLRTAGKARRTQVKSNLGLNDNRNIAFRGKKGYYRNRIEYIPNRGAAGLAHEIGHTIEREEGGLVGKVIDRLSDIARDDQARNKSPEEKGLLRSAKRYFQGRLISENERRATESGLKLMKKVGASDKLLKRSREELEGSLGTYKSSARVSSKRPLYNLIKTKDDPKV